MRQYLFANLSRRITTRPFFSAIEKVCARRGGRRDGTRVHWGEVVTSTQRQ